MVTAGQDGVARVWRVADGGAVQSFTHGAPLSSAAFDPAGTRVATAAADGIARIWTLRSPQRPLRAVALRRRCAQRLLPSAQTGAGSSPPPASDDDARVWRPSPTGQPAPEAGGPDDEPVNSVAFSPDGSRILTASVDADLRLWNTGTPRNPSGPARPRVGRERRGVQPRRPPGSGRRGDPPSACGRRRRTSGARGGRAVAVPARPRARARRRVRPDAGGSRASATTGRSARISARSAVPGAAALRAARAAARQAGRANLTPAARRTYLGGVSPSVRSLLELVRLGRQRGSRPAGRRCGPAASDHVSSRPCAEPPSARRRRLRRPTADAAPAGEQLADRLARAAVLDRLLVALCASPLTNGSRTKLVTSSLAIVRAALNVAAASTARSRVELLGAAAAEDASAADAGHARAAEPDERA